MIVSAKSSPSRQKDSTRSQVFYLCDMGIVFAFFHHVAKFFERDIKSFGHEYEPDSKQNDSEFCARDPQEDRQH